MTQVDEAPDSSAGNPTRTPVQSARVGEVLAERYELVKHINQDAWGRQVWRGVDVLLRRPVGVVLRQPGGQAAAEMLAAAVATSRVMHPHLIGVYDAADEGDRAYVVREWVEGQALRDVLETAPLDGRRATSVAHAVADAIAALHAAGITHGNIHPGTVLVGGDGRVVLADARADESATPEGDVRATGATLYAALTGYWPHREAGRSSLPDAPREASGRLVPPHQVRGGVPMNLSNLASDLLSPEVEPPTSDALAGHLRRLDTEATDPVFGGDSLNLDDLDDVAVPGRERRGGRFAIGIAALLVLAIIGLLLGTRWLTSPSSSGPGASSQGTGAPGGRPSAGQQVVQLPIAASRVRIVDPKGDGTELADAAKTVDGNYETGWKTDHYTTADFGHNKPGMGVLVDLGAIKDVKSVTVAMATSGATVQLMSGPTDPGRGQDDQVLATFQPIGNQAGPDSGPTISFPVGQQARYLLVWITKLPLVAPGTQWPYGAGIQEIKVLGTP